MKMESEEETQQAADTAAPNRKIINNLLSSGAAVLHIKEEKAEEDCSAVAATPARTTVTAPTPIYHTSSRQYTAAAPPGATILRYAQTSDGQQILVVVQAESSDTKPRQICIAPGVIKASPSALPAQDATEVSRREVYRMKNREAAREHRRRKKEYMRCLEKRVVELENEIKMLIGELKALKDFYYHNDSKAP
ncbi:cyclic AMP-responsive element-binding protein 1 [Oryzias melastigma]|uniref:cyclic AMP-responsive element-binding protein 1 n=1 Tax=Oryzias melastigma TaxID=30732 RepID=UPI000CF7E199|nr:cyclic AMP-responsive element-binding protein 1 [Oryzias melastigma]